MSVITLVGRPNVGKSTLFNRLTRTKDALVADFAGLTRDRKYGRAKFSNKSFIVIDTGGIGVEDAQIDSLTLQQSNMAVDEANIIFFVVDGRLGITSDDHEIASFLRKKDKPVYLIVNKMDGMDAVTALADFYKLGFNSVFPISASHGGGVDGVLKNACNDFPENIEPKDEDGVIRVAFIGRPNVGKSTLVNRILGEERVVVCDMPGTTRDSVHIAFVKDDQKFELVDTAGVRKRGRVNEKIEKFSVIKTLQAIEKSHVCLVLFDAKEGLTEQDMHILGLVLDAGRALIVVANKWDGLDSDHKEQIKQKLLYKLQFARFARQRFISALHGSGVGQLFKDIHEAYCSATKAITTSELNRCLGDLTHAHTPPLVRGRRIKLRYAHLGGHNPPNIVIHGNQLDELPESYKRYLISGFIEYFKLIGTPVLLSFKTSDNPYKDRKNVLTDSQRRSRKRLMKHVTRRR